ncbi:hypothetical protein BD560DRAFT_420173 [Blakeslea trispora]|nr:hypothetical protein BD560DRAFT_420173 [Blakeslea trispora]
MNHTKSNGLALDCLPDEILVLILSQSILPISTLQAMQSISDRLHVLCNYVLTYKRFPAIHLDVSIDQEGKSRVTTVFRFKQFCSDKANIQFVSSQPHKPRRYYTGKAAPVIRMVRMTDTYMQAQSTLVDHLDEKTQTEDMSLKKKNYGSKSMKLRTLRDGIYKIEKSKHLLFNKSICFNLTYKISCRQQSEYHASLLGISLSSDYLLKQISVNSYSGTAKPKHSLCHSLTCLIKRYF